MGAIVSFELARLLRKQYSTKPIHLFISGCRAPQIPDLDPPIHAMSEHELFTESFSTQSIPTFTVYPKLDFIHFWFNQAA